MLYKKIENKDLDKTLVEYIGYVFTPFFGPHGKHPVGFVKATDEDVRREYDSGVERQLKEESDLVWDKKKRKWVTKNDSEFRAIK